MPEPTASSARRARRVPWLLILLVVAAAPRLAILATSQRWLRSDEALVGIQAKRVLTRGEPVWFLAGQSYGGGHALLSYALAPWCAAFGPRGALVNAGPMVLSLVNVALLWLLLRGRVPWPAAALATTLYALAPAVMYQSFLANGGGFAFLLGMLSLHAFLRVGPDGRRTALLGFALGFTCGLAIYAMDYAAVYPLTYALLFLLFWRGFFASRAFPAGVAGGVLGLAPLLAYNLTHGWAHVRRMLAPAPPGAASPGALSAFHDYLLREAPVLFTTRLDDYGAAPAGWDAWGHWLVFLAAFLAAAAWRRRGETWTAGLRRRPVETISLVAVVVYLGLYGLSRFSAPLFRTPRYFIPLYPFVSILIGAMLARAFASKATALRLIGAALSVALLGQSLAQDWRMTDATGHEEHHVLTSGRSIRALAEWLEARGIGCVFTRYEIQMRLMAESDERILASCVLGPRRLLSPKPRLPGDDLAVLREARGGAPFAVVFRRDFAFGRLWPDPRTRSRQGWEGWLRSLGVRWKQADVGEFVVYYDFSSRRLLGG